jgi:general secretion pathway protein G
MGTYTGSVRIARQRGFTLLELLVVLVILGLLGALVGPRLFDQLDRSKVRTAETQVHMLKSALDTMRLDIGRYPTGEEGLQLLITAPLDPQLRVLWHGPYLENQVPLDPWNKPYLYRPEGRDLNAVALYSLGADGKPGDDVIGLPPRN